MLVKPVQFESSKRKVRNFTIGVRAGTLKIKFVLKI